MSEHRACQEEDPIKVIVLGACAHMAVPFLPALLREEDVTQVTLADRDALGLRRRLPPSR